MGDPELIACAQKELKNILGPQVDSWKALRVYRIERALNLFSPADLMRRKSQEINLPDWLYACGDHLETPSIEGAVISGKKAASSVLRTLGLR
jgi:predicted NAD/FAD-dependent oxidoreductase